MNGHFDHYDDIPDGDWCWADFTPAEMACRHCGAIIVVHGFMESLQALRTIVGVPFPVTSGTRCPDYDKRLGGAGVHPTGLAVDPGVKIEFVVVDPVNKTISVDTERKALEEWKMMMAESDIIDMDRKEEDHHEFEHGGRSNDTRQGGTQDRYNAKKALRDTRPE